MCPWSKSWRTRVVIDSLFVYHFIDPDLRVKTFFQKRWSCRKWRRWFQNRGCRHLCTLVLKVEENIMQSLSAPLFCLTGDRKYLLKALLTCTFIPSLLNSKWRKNYTLRLLLTYLEALEEEFSCFPRRDWEGDRSNLFSLVRLYQRI